MKIKTSIISETIELEQNGEVAKTIPFSFDSSLKWAEVNRYRFKMAENKDNPEQIGKLFLEMMHYVLGKAADELIEYYNGNWEGMIVDLAPLFINVIYPACDEAHDKAINGLKRKKRSIFRRRNG
jgi:hypothetical protein